MKEKFIFIVNPKAGKNNNAVMFIDRIQAAIKTFKLDAEIYITKSVGDAREYVKKRSEKAFNGVGEYAPGESQCRFCRAKAQCRARADRNLELAGFTAEKPPLLSNDEVGEYLKKGEDVAKWLSDLKDYALSECLAGKEVAGWKAVEGRGSRVWTDADAAFKELIDSGTPEEMLYERKQLTLAGVEKLLGKKEFESKVGKYVDKKPGKPALVVESDKRQAITNTISAEDAFK